MGGLFTLLALLVQPFYSINLWFSDQLFTAQTPSPVIVIAGIDDSTLETYGRWADWQRSLHAQAIDNLSQAGAKVIGFDVIFTDSSPDDEMLATAMAEADNIVLAAVGTQLVSQAGAQITYDNVLLPTAPLEQAASNIGHANVIPDGDGTVRRLPLVVGSSSGQVYPSLALAVLYRLFSMPPPPEYPLKNGTINLLARDIPVDTSCRIRINFSADNANRPYVSYGDVISGGFDPSLVKNKIVLIGMTATGEPDAWAPPLSRQGSRSLYTRRCHGYHSHGAFLDRAWYRHHANDYAGAGWHHCLCLAPMRDTAPDRYSQGGGSNGGLICRLSGRWLLSFR